MKRKIIMRKQDSVGWNNFGLSYFNYPTLCDTKEYFIPLILTQLTTLILIRLLL